MAEIPAPDPQAILKMLETELTMKRQNRKAAPASHTPMRLGSLFFVVALLAVALFALNYLAEVARASRPAASPSADVSAPQPTNFLTSEARN